MEREEGEYLFDVSDIVAHIFFAVGSTDHVRVSSPLGDFSGTFAYPKGDEVFLRCTAFPAVSPGMTLFVDYAGAGDNYRFHTEVVSVQADQIQIRLPTAIECSDRRLTQRKAVAAGAGFCFVAEGGGPERTFLVSDLSDGGIAFVDARHVPLTVGDIVSGALHLPAQAPLDIGLEIRHLPDIDGQRLVGARFVSISLADRGRLARFLVSL